MAKAAAVLGALGVIFVALSFLPEFRAAAGNQPLTPAVAAHGQRLFTAKGCAACHRHAEVVASDTTGHVGAPDLTDYRGDPDFLRLWLRDPQAIRPGTRMPDLDLSDDEIEALIAFLSIEADQ